MKNTEEQFESKSKRKRSCKSEEILVKPYLSHLNDKVVTYIVNEHTTILLSLR